ncbi:MAG: CHAT domain-containing protein [Bacteroidota bacterium]
MRIVLKKSILILLLMSLTATLWAQSDLPEYRAQIKKFYQKGRYNDALRLARRVRSIVLERHNSNHYLYADALDNLALLNAKVGNYDKAERFYEECIEVRKSVQGRQHTRYAASLEDLARLYIRLGQYQKSKVLLREALAIWERYPGQKQSLSDVLSNLALTYEKLNELQDSKRYYQRATKAKYEHYGKEHPSYARSLSDMGVLLLKMEEYEQAYVLFSQAQRIFKKNDLEAHPSYANLLANFGQLLTEQGDYDTAQSKFTQALTILEQTGSRYSPNYTSVMAALAQSYHYSGNLVGATQAYEEVIKAKINEINQVRPALSEAERRTYLRRTESIFDAYISFALSEARESSQTVEALFDLQLVRKGLIFASTKEVQRQILASKDTTLIGLYSVWKEQRAFLATIRQMDETEKEAQGISEALIQNQVNHLEKELSRRSKDFAQTRRPQQTTWKDIQAKLHPDEILVDITRVERVHIKREFRYYGKGLLLGDGGLIEGIASAESPAGRTILEKGDRVLSINGEPSENYLSHELAEQLKATEQTNLEVQTQAGVRNLKLKSDSIFRKRPITDTVYVALVLRAGLNEKPELVVFEEGQKMENEYLRFYRNSIQYQTEDYDSFERFWSPIERYFSINTQKIFLCPDGAYHRVNPSTLLNPEDETYIFDRYDIQTIGNPKEILNTSRRSRETGEIVLFGFPAYDKRPSDQNETLLASAELPMLSAQALEQQRFWDNKSSNVTPLKETEVEVEQIEEQATNAGYTTQLFMGTAASEEQLKAVRNPKILHIATHGFYFPSAFKTQNPLLLSGLLLAGAELTLKGEKLETEDGILLAEEVLGLHLEDTELVILSACETGLGQVRFGEGVYGLQRSFRQAGAESVMMSLWRVSDQATRLLMTTFYQELFATQVSEREALRIAQREVREQFPEPYYWGSFVLVGQ